ncbi:MAG: P-II family nitrogen regulator [Desulfovibrio sp.]|uniref:P-II family nitrogen regulator n=1 Tax=Desulfovibrio sp. 7SRBS1 TaxID=3378064 RepID=UPI003B3E66BF
MKLIIAYIRPEKLNAVKQALYAKNIYSLSVTNVLGSGRQGGFTETYRGVAMEVNLLKKLRIDLVISDDLEDMIIETIAESSRTGKEGDGVIFVQEIARTKRIRTGEDTL